MPKLELDANHVYSIDGRKIDGLTSTIQEGGLISHHASEWYMTRGTYIHLAAEYYDKGELDESTVDPQIKGYLESWKRFRKDQDYTPTRIEYQTYHPELMVGMRIDRLPGPLDLKSGSPEPWHILQIAVQWSCIKAWESSDSLKYIASVTNNPMDVYLDPEGGPPKIKAYKASELREAFKVYASMLVYLRWRREKYGNASNHQP